MKKRLTVLMTASLVLFSSLFAVAISSNSENHVVYSSIKVYTDNPGH
ncbi:hypothetical protein [Brevibacillus laterosporus]|nr:hypothetical protein [Brevibacillus laterosporus]MCG7319777.1 hypothetical protein [Brevibacillus laterosporus]